MKWDNLIVSWFSWESIKHLRYKFKKLENGLVLNFLNNYLVENKNVIIFNKNMLK